MKQQVPLLIISDCPSQSSGLARITRDLATVVATMPEFRVATLGWMGVGRRDLPFHTYHMHEAEFGEVSLPQVWDDWAQGEPGIVLTIWDLSRMLWLACPQHCEIDSTREWLIDARVHKFKLHAYVPIDSMGPHGRLTAMSREVLLGCDRLLAYTPFAEEVIRRTIGNEAAEHRGISWMPHGLNTRVFQPAETQATMPVILTRSNVMSEHAIHEAGGTLAGDVGGAPHTDGGQGNVDCVAGNDRTLEPSSTVVGAGEHEDNALASSSTASTIAPVRIGIVATNQFRKDFGLMAAVMARLAEELKGNVRFWIHTDREVHYWSLPALVADFGLGEYVDVTVHAGQDDRWMAEMYRMCDCTLHPGSEGWGFPIFESLACGVPAIHGDYAGGASAMRTCGLEDLLVQPRNWRLQGTFNCIRPVYDVEDWVAKVMEVLRPAPGKDVYVPHLLAKQVEHLGWLKLAPVWKRWLREGL